MNYLNTATAFTLFGKARKNEIYVDKSLLIEKISGKIDTNSQYICITRPRRFGKSMNVHMMGAYYTKGIDCSSLFENLAITKTRSYETHRNKYNVIYIDFSRMPDCCSKYPDYARICRKHTLLSKIKYIFPSARCWLTAGNILYSF